MARLTPKQKQLADQLIRTEWPKLERFFRTKVAPGDIDELAQQTFIGYVERFDAVTADHRAYLWQIARYQVIGFWNYKRVRGSEPFMSSVHTVADFGPTMSSVLNRRSRLVRALQSLPADHQMAIELRHGEGLTLEETAVALEVSLATIKRYLAAAEQRLGELLGADAPGAVAAYRAGTS